jgi:hypothetical protein
MLGSMAGDLSRLMRRPKAQNVYLPKAIAHSFIPIFTLEGAIANQV